MKCSIVIAATLLSLASASSWSVTEVRAANSTFGADDVASVHSSELTEFYACNKFSLQNNIFDIKEVTLNPNPPRKKTDVKIVVRGHIKESIERGAYIKATIKKGALKHTLDYDFCKGIETGCPVPAGDVVFWTGQYISKLVPSGMAKIQFRPYTADGRIMGCVEVPVTLVEA